MIDEVRPLSRVTRYTLVPESDTTAPVRRYRLARLGASSRPTIGEDRLARLERVAAGEAERARRHAAAAAAVAGNGGAPGLASEQLGEGVEHRGAPTQSGAADNQVESGNGNGSVRGGLVGHRVEPGPGDAPGSGAASNGRGLDPAADGEVPEDIGGARASRAAIGDSTAAGTASS